MDIKVNFWIQCFPQGSFSCTRGNQSAESCPQQETFLWFWIHCWKTFFWPGQNKRTIMGSTISQCCVSGNSWNVNKMPRLQVVRECRAGLLSFYILSELLVQACQPVSENAVWCWAMSRCSKIFSSFHWIHDEDLPCTFLKETFPWYDKQCSTQLFPVSWFSHFLGLQHYPLHEFISGPSVLNIRGRRR